MTIFHAILLGIIEGITEFLPISSTGHLILASELLNLKKTAFLSSFEIGIQLGAICSIVVIYFKKVLAQKALFKTVFIAFLPTVIVGLIAYKSIKTMLMNNSYVVLASLLIGGIILILFEIFYKEKLSAVGEVEQIQPKQAVVIGLFQCLSMVPGVSRAAATIIGGLTLGIKRKAIVEFSFLLAIPTMFAATVLDLYKTGAAFAGNEWFLLIIGFITSFFVAWISVKWLLRYIQKHTFIAFGFYRIAVAIVFWLILL